MRAYDAQVRANQEERRAKEALKALKAKRERERKLSGVFWCEKDGWQNGHAFSSKDDQAEVVTRRVKTNKTDDYGEAVYRQEEFNICGPHANGLFQSANPDQKAVEATVVSPDDPSLDLRTPGLVFGVARSGAVGIPGTG